MDSRKDQLCKIFAILMFQLYLRSTAATDIDCNGKSFHCVNTTHFMICVDLGGGLSKTFNDFVIQCPPTTVCGENNHLECTYQLPTTIPTTEVEYSTLYPSDETNEFTIDTRTTTMSSISMKINTTDISSVTELFNEYFNTIDVTTNSKYTTEGQRDKHEDLKILDKSSTNNDNPVLTTTTDRYSVESLFSKTLKINSQNNESLNSMPPEVLNLFQSNSRVLPLYPTDLSLAANTSSDIEIIANRPDGPGIKTEGSFKKLIDTLQDTTVESPKKDASTLIDLELNIQLTQKKNSGITTKSFQEKIATTESILLAHSPSAEVNYYLENTSVKIENMTTPPLLDQDDPDLPEILLSNSILNSTRVDSKIESTTDDNLMGKITLNNLLHTSSAYELNASKSTESINFTSQYSTTEPTITTSEYATQTTIAGINLNGSEILMSSKESEILISTSYTPKTFENQVTDNLTITSAAKKENITSFDSKLMFETETTTSSSYANDKTSSSDGVLLDGSSAMTEENVIGKTTPMESLQSSSPYGVNDTKLTESTNYTFQYSTTEPIITTSEYATQATIASINLNDSEILMSSKESEILISTSYTPTTFENQVTDNLTITSAAKKDNITSFDSNLMFETETTTLSAYANDKTSSSDGVLLDGSSAMTEENVTSEITPMESLQSSSPYGVNKSKLTESTNYTFQYSTTEPTITSSEYTIQTTVAGISLNDSEMLISSRGSETIVSAVYTPITFESQFTDDLTTKVAAKKENITSLDEKKLSENATTPVVIEAGKETQTPIMETIPSSSYANDKTLSPDVELLDETSVITETNLIRTSPMELQNKSSFYEFNESKITESNNFQLQYSTTEPTVTPSEYTTQTKQTTVAGINLNESEILMISELSETFSSTAQSPIIFESQVTDNPLIKSATKKVNFTSFDNKLIYENSTTPTVIEAGKETQKPITETIPLSSYANDKTSSPEGEIQYETSSINEANLLSQLTPMELLITSSTYELNESKLTESSNFTFQYSTTEPTITPSEYAIQTTVAGINLNDIEILMSYKGSETLVSTVHTPITFDSQVTDDLTTKSAEKKDNIASVPTVIYVDIEKQKPITETIPSSPYVNTKTVSPNVELLNETSPIIEVDLIRTTTPMEILNISFPREQNESRISESNNITIQYSSTESTVTSPEYGIHITVDTSASLNDSETLMTFQGSETLLSTAHSSIIFKSQVTNDNATKSSINKDNITSFDKKIMSENSTIPTVIDAVKKIQNPLTETIPLSPYTNDKILSPADELLDGTSSVSTDNLHFDHTTSTIEYQSIIPDINLAEQKIQDNEFNIFSNEKNTSEATVLGDISVTHAKTHNLSVNTEFNISNDDLLDLSSLTTLHSTIKSTEQTKGRNENISQISPELSSQGSTATVNPSSLNYYVPNIENNTKINTPPAHNNYKLSYEIMTTTPHLNLKAQSIEIEGNETSHTSTAINKLLSQEEYVLQTTPIITENAYSYDTSSTIQNRSSTTELNLEDQIITDNKAHKLSPYEINDEFTTVTLLPTFDQEIVKQETHKNKAIETTTIPFHILLQYANTNETSRQVYNLTQSEYHDSGIDHLQSNEATPTFHNEMSSLKSEVQDILHSVGSEINSTVTIQGVNEMTNESTTIRPELTTMATINSVPEFQIIKDEHLNRALPFTDNLDSNITPVLQDGQNPLIIRQDSVISSTQNPTMSKNNLLQVNQVILESEHGMPNSISDVNISSTMLDTMKYNKTKEEVLPTSVDKKIDELSTHEQTTIGVIAKEIPARKNKNGKPINTSNIMFDNIVSPVVKIFNSSKILATTSENGDFRRKATSDNVTADLIIKQLNILPANFSFSLYNENSSIKHDTNISTSDSKKDLLRKLSNNPNNTTNNIHMKDNNLNKVNKEQNSTYRLLLVTSGKPMHFDTSLIVNKSREFSKERLTIDEISLNNQTILNLTSNNTDEINSKDIGNFDDGKSEGNNTRKEYNFTGVPENNASNNNKQNIPMGYLESVTTVSSPTLVTVLKDDKETTLDTKLQKALPSDGSNYKAAAVDGTIIDENLQMTTTVTSKVNKIIVAEQTIVKTEPLNNTNVGMKTKKRSTSTNLYSCNLRIRGRFADKNNCRKYYICIGKNEPILGECPKNTVFSEITKQCTKNLSHCIRNNQFRCTQAGRFSDVLRSNIYYICVNNNNTYVRFQFQCNNGFHLNKISVRCVKDVKYESLIMSVSIDSTSNKGSDQSTVERKSIETKKDKKDTNYICNNEGKFPDADDCRRYYVCTKNSKSVFRRRTKKCDSDEVFNREKKKCVDIDSYECT